MAIWEQPELISGESIEVTGGERKKAELALCIPHQEIVTMEWALMFRNLQLPSHLYFFNRGMPIDLAREQMVRSALKHDINYILFIDTDNVPESTDAVMVLKEIMERNNISILSGLYWARKRDVNSPAAWKLIGREGNTVKLSPIIIEKEWLDKGAVIQVDAIGMGFCLIKTDVFRKLEEKNPGKPFFQWGLGRPNLPQVSEDFYFCLRVIDELGIYPYITTAVPVKHITLAEKTGKTGEFQLVAV